MATEVATSYIHSRIVTKIIDNSIVEEEVNVPVGFILFQPYFSTSGEDNHVILWDKETEFVRENGNPNITTHGQHIYNAIQWLKGGGKLLGLRLTANDARPAFAVLNVRTKHVANYTVDCPFHTADPDAEDTSLNCEERGNEDNDTEFCAKYRTTALRISTTFTPIPPELITNDIMSMSENLMLKQLMATIKSEAEKLNTPANYAAASEDMKKLHTEGWTNHFLTIFKINGAGKFGNDYGLTFSLDQTREEDLEDSRRYFYTVYKRDENGNLERKTTPYSISFNPSATDSTGLQSEFIDTVVKSEDYQKEFTGIGVYTDEKEYNKLFELFGKYIAPVTCSKVPANTVIPKLGNDARFVDFFTLVDQEGNSYKRFLDPTAEEKAAMETAGVPDMDFRTEQYLMNGSDGSLDKNNYLTPNPTDEDKPYTINGVANKTEKEVDAAIQIVKDNLLYDAYAGKIDPNIISPYKYQISCVIDAGNTPDVKKQMIYFCRERLDVVAYLDCSSAPSVQAAKNFRDLYLTGFYDWNASLWPQAGVAYDIYTKRNIDVTYCFDIAYKLPNLRNTEGPNRLMAGTKKGAVATMSSLNWYPDEDQKTELLKKQMNYVEEVRLKQYAIMSTRTLYDKRLSYLAVIRNAHCICEAVYVGRQILTDLRFEEVPSIAMTKAKEQITRNLMYLISNGPVERLTVVASQSQQEAYENAASVTIEMKFTDFIHTWKFNIVAAR